VNVDPDTLADVELAFWLLGHYVDSARGFYLKTRATKRNANSKSLVRLQNEFVDSFAALSLREFKFVPHDLLLKVSDTIRYRGSQ
jgi:hypothetical protein